MRESLDFCKECGDSLGGSIDYDHFCFGCVIRLMAERTNGDINSESPNYEEASGEYWREKFDQWARETPPFWQTPLEDPA